MSSAALARTVTHRPGAVEGAGPRFRGGGGPRREESDREAKVLSPRPTRSRVRYVVEHEGRFHLDLHRGGGEKRSPSDGLPDDRLMNVERKYAGPAQSVRMESVSRPAEQLHEILTDGRRHPRRDDLLDLLTQE